MIRSMEALRQQQLEVLASWRDEQSGAESVAMLPRPGAMVAPATYGRVSAVVGSDATYGPHLMVVRQRWSGMPPTVSDGSGAAVRGYPAPSRVVGDYAVGEYVRLEAAHGALVVEKLG